MDSNVFQSSTKWIQDGRYRLHHRAKRTQRFRSREGRRDTIVREWNPSAVSRLFFVQWAGFHCWRHYTDTFRVHKIVFKNSFISYSLHTGWYYSSILLFFAFEDCSALLVKSHNSMSQKIRGQTKYYFWRKRLTSEKNENIEDSVAGRGSFYMNYCNATALQGDQ